MRRLYSSFASGAPGAGLLLMRAAAGTALVVCGAVLLGRAPQLLSAMQAVGAAGLGVLLLLGLWTPVAGTLAALAALWAGFMEPSPHDGYYALLATLGAALALLGPGAWSVDARLFGWKRVEIGRGGNRPPLERD
jgi:putative oxidoreductase